MLKTRAVVLLQKRLDLALFCGAEGWLVERQEHLNNHTNTEATKKQMNDGSSGAAGGGGGHWMNSPVNRSAIICTGPVSADQTKRETGLPLHELDLLRLRQPHESS